jgi:methionine-rich copper-binding protein CopC
MQLKLKLKQLGVTLALAGMLSTQAYAHEAAVSEAAPLAAAAAQAAPANVLTQDDLVALFGAQEAANPCNWPCCPSRRCGRRRGRGSYP